VSIVFQESPVTARASHDCAICTASICIGDRALRCVTLDVEPRIGFAWWYECVECEWPAAYTPPRRRKGRVSQGGKMNHRQAASRRHAKLA